MGLETLAGIFMRALAGKLGRLAAYKVFRRISGPLCGLAVLLFGLALLRFVGMQWPSFLHSWLTHSVPVSLPR